MTATTETAVSPETRHETGAAAQRERPGGQLWVSRGCALVVAAVAAYSSYGHQRQFALDGGADDVTAALWPLSVDGLLILASTGLLASRTGTSWRARWSGRLAFLLGVTVSLAANIAAAPSLTWQPVIVAGWPPLALLLAVELVIHSRQRACLTDTGSRLVGIPLDAAEMREPTDVIAERRTAEDVMWAHYEREVAEGRTPSGAELDRVAGTNNYGRAVLARWRRSGRLANVGASPAQVADP